MSWIEQWLDEMGRLFASKYGMPPATGRVLGWLLVCDPPQRTAAALVQDLGLSRSAIGAAVATLEGWGYVVRSRGAGSRFDVIVMAEGATERSLSDTTEYRQQAEIARRALQATQSPRARAQLTELVVFAEFLQERLPQLAEEWRICRGTIREERETAPSRGSA